MLYLAIRNTDGETYGTWFWKREVETAIQDGGEDRENGNGIGYAGPLCLPEMRLYSCTQARNPLFPHTLRAVRFPNDAYIYNGSISNAMGV